MKIITRGLAIVAALLVAAGATAQKVDGKDDFRRERKGKSAQKKDALEGKPAPALQLASWMNTAGGKPLDLAKLHGKVVVLKFWGVW